MTETFEAERLIFDRMPRAGTCRQPLEHCAGRVLAEEIFADRDQPPFDRVTMDGIAIAFADWAAGTRRYDIVGTQAAGAPPLNPVPAGRCAEVMTGAVLPAGTDTVVPVERIARHGDGRGAVAEIAADAPIEKGQFIHRRGGDRRRGDALLVPGRRIGPAETAVLASAGAAEVPVAELPRIAVVSTGDELVDVDESPAPHQIRSSNDRALEAALRRHQLGSVTRRRFADDADAMLEGIERLHASHDVLILSGGVSMGQFDFVPAVLERLGVEVVFHKIEQKPGRPMWFGTSAEGKPVFALPGNPVSTLVCAARYVVPALESSLGLAPAPLEYAVLTEPVTMPKTLTLFMPVLLRSSGAGVLEATPRPTNTSGDFVSLAGTDGFVELPRGPAAYDAGTVARLFRW